MDQFNRKTLGEGMVFVYVTLALVGGLCAITVLTAAAWKWLGL